MFIRQVRGRHATDPRWPGDIARNDLAIIRPAFRAKREGRLPCRNSDTIAPPRSRQHRQYRPRERLHHRPALGDALLRHRTWPHPRSLYQYGLPQHVDQCRHGSIPSADGRGRTCCVASPALWCRTVPHCSTGWRQVRKPLQGTKFDSARAMIVSRPSARGAIASTSMLPTRLASDAFVLGMPYIEFDVRPGTASGIARFYREIVGARSEVVGNGDGRKGPGAGRREAISIFPRNRRPGETLRQASRPDFHH